MKINVKGPIISNDDQWIYDWFEVEATSPKKVSDLITQAEQGEELEIEINSGGGSVFAGSEIYTELKNYNGPTTVKILGIAASAASVIAMAGKKVAISPTAQIMIHNVSTYSSGDYRDLQHDASVIENMNKSVANAYRLKTNLSQEELLEMMDTETWLNAQQAKEKGFADEIMFDNSNILVNSFGSGMIPQQIIDKMRNEREEKKAKETQDQLKNQLDLEKAKLNLRRVI